MSPTIPYKTIFEQLEKQKIKYLVAGGFAVNFHQVQRATVLIRLKEVANRDKDQFDVQQLKKNTD